MTNCKRHNAVIGYGRVTSARSTTSVKSTVIFVVLRCMLMLLGSINVLNVNWMLVCRSNIQLALLVGCFKLNPRLTGGGAFDAPPLPNIRDSSKTNSAIDVKLGRPSHTTI